MQSPHPPRPPYPPRPGGAPGNPTVNLAAQLRAGPRVETGHAVALLTGAALAGDVRLRGHLPRHLGADRLHGRRRRLPPGARAAERGESAHALRPQLLVAVRDTVREWAADDGISGRAAGTPQTDGRPRSARGEVHDTRKAETRRACIPGSSGSSPSACCGTPRSRPSPFPYRPVFWAWTRAPRRPRWSRPASNSARAVYAPTGNSRRPRNAASTTASSTSRSAAAAPCCPMSQQHLLECRYCRSRRRATQPFRGRAGRSARRGGARLGRPPLSRLPARAQWPGVYPQDRPAGAAGAPAVVGIAHGPLPLPDERFNRPKGRTRAVVVGVGVLSFALLASVIGLRDPVGRELHTEGRLGHGERLHDRPGCRLALRRPEVGQSLAAGR